jgi:uncharacterized protein YidB (DUF937 family)
MGILDKLGGGMKDVVEVAGSAAMQAAISEGLKKTNLGNYQGVVNQLQQGGLGPQVQSWIGNGKNMSVTPDQLKAVLSNDHVKQLAQHFGVNPDATLKLLADNLPAAVAQASKDGTVR